MAATLPIPINFRLPDGWQPAPPDEMGVPGVAFVALHPASRDNFTANITIRGEVRNDAAPLAEIADESLERLRRHTARAEMTQRRNVGTSEAPGLTQLVKMRAEANGVERDLVQAQVYLSLVDTEDRRKRVVLELVMTTTATQFATLVEDFQQFVGSVRPVSPES